MQTAVTLNLPRDNAQISQAAQKSLGLPAGLKLLGPRRMNGMNQTDSRFYIDDEELFYVENLIRLGNGRYRALYDIGTPLYTVPANANKTIASFFWFNIGFVFYCAVFYSDGTADQVDTMGNVVTISAIPGTFYRGSNTPLPACCQSGTALLLISNNNTNNDYWIWDGTILYASGTLGPNPTLTDAGANYTSAPTVTTYGGTGSGAVVTARVSGGSVVAFDITDPGSGYSPGDIVQLNVSGGGSDSSAQLQAVITAGQVQSIVVTAPGSGYLTAPTVAITSGGGSGATAIAILGTGTQAGQVIGFQITDPGLGYTSTPSVGLSGGSGSGAAGLAVVNGGAVTAITVIDGGTNFTGTPLLTIEGGGGSGATATAVMSGGSIASVTITNGGAGYTGTVAVVVQTGLNNAAAGTVLVMPFGVSGYAMEVFTARVFVGPPAITGPGQLPNGGTFFVSTPGSLTDFATSDGGLLFTTTDRFLRASYTNFRQSNGYLYPFGDSSISVISNVQTSGSPLATTFTYQNIDPQTGTQWRDSCQDYARTILFANPFGVFGLYGGAVTKVSGKIERIFQNAVFPTTAFPATGQPTYPTSAVCNIFNEKAYCLLMDITSPLTGDEVQVLLVWNEKDWTVSRIETQLAYIGTQEIASNLTAWGTDGKSLFKLFNQPSAIIKTMATKLYGIEQSLITKQAMVTYLQCADMSGDGVSFDLTLESEMGGWLATGEYGFQNWSTYVLDAAEDQNPIAVPTVPAVPNSPLLVARGLDVIGEELGLTVTSNSTDFELYNITLAATDIAAVFG
jgi:hypothetical protein